MANRKRTNNDLHNITQKTRDQNGVEHQYAQINRSKINRTYKTNGSQDDSNIVFTWKS